jgi:hypothetical protein
MYFPFLCCTDISFAPTLFPLWLSSLLSRRNIKKKDFFTLVNDCVARYLITIPRLLFALALVRSPSDFRTTYPYMNRKK